MTDFHLKLPTMELANTWVPSRYKMPNFLQPVLERPTPMPAYRPVPLERPKETELVVSVVPIVGMPAASRIDSFSAS